MQNFLNRFVVVRGRDSGVNCGYLEEIYPADGVAVIRESRKIWGWDGAHTCHELANAGASMDDTRISEPTELVAMLDVVEILLCTDAARDNLSQSRWSA